MPHSTRNAPQSKLYLPGSAASLTSVTEESPLHTYFAQAIDGVEDYARREPWTFAACVFGVGFVLGWRLKPW